MYSRDIYYGQNGLRLERYEYGCRCVRADIILDKSRFPWAFIEEIVFSTWNKPPDTESGWQTHRQEGHKVIWRRDIYTPRGRMLGFMRWHADHVKKASLRS